MTGAPALVSIGIPTYNRANTIQRAICSALAQDYGELEVVVSDDASPDGTLAVLRRLADTDPRLRVLEQPVNLGHARNFQVVLEAARGEYFMWLSDDDWIDPGYVSRCVAILRSDPSYALVAGLASYHAGGEHVVDERPTDLLSSRPGARVLAYFARVNVNGPLFGLARREDLTLRGFPDEVGGDWLLVAGMAARGRVRTLRDVRIHRSAEGLGTDPQSLARSFGLSGLAARHHHVVVATRLARDVLTGPAYARMTPAQRGVTAALSAALVLGRFPVYDAVMGTLRRAGLGVIEQHLIALVRRRDQR
jgi:hypothetical protein